MTEEADTRESLSFVIHVNSEFADQASDHDLQVARLDLRGKPTTK